MTDETEKYAEALSYVPVLLQVLDGVKTAMLADIMQACLEYGMELGRNEAKKTP